MTTESILVAHARRELELCGQTAEDPEFAASLVAAIEAFASYGHSGGSAFCAIEMLHDLLRFRPLSPLTTNRAEWTHVGDVSDGVPIWQSKRDPAVFSEDNCATAYRVDGPGREPVPLQAA